MGKSLYKLKELICKEIDNLASQGELTAGSLDTVDKLTHSLKSIETIIAMEDSGYSQAPYPHYGTRHYNYSRDSERDKMVEQLRSILDKASTEKDRNAIRNCISQVEG